MISLPVIQQSLIDRFVNLVNTFQATQNLDQDVLMTLIYDKNKKFKSFSEKFTMEFSIKNSAKQNEEQKVRCQNFIKNKVYMCFDCQIHRQAFLCEDCFNGVRHDIKCHFTVKQLPEQFHGIYKCCCGDLKKMSYRGTCHHHKRSVQKAPIISEEDQLIVKYITQCFELFLILKYNEQVLISNNPSRTVLQEYDIKTISHKYIDSLIKFIRKLLLDGFEITPLIQKSLLTPISIKQFIENPLNFNLFKQITKDQHILGILLRIKCIYSYQSFAILDGLIEDCIKYQSFQYISQLVRQSIFLLHKNGSSYLMTALNSFKKEHTVNTELYCTVLCTLAQKNILVSKKNYQKQTLTFYYQAACPDHNLEQKNKHILNLIPCWKELRKQKIFTIQNILRINKSHLLLYLMLIVQDEQLFTQLLRELIIITSNKIKINEDKQNKLEKVQKMNISEICNVISKLLTAFTRGKTLDIKKFLIGLNLDAQFCKIAFYYLYESIQKINNLGGVTLEIFSRYIQLLRQQRQEQYQKYCAYWKNTKIQQQKFIEYSSKMINILIGQQLKIIGKLVPYLKQKPLQLQNQQQKKLKQVLYMNKVISKKQLSYLAKQKCLNFEKARQIIKQYTKYDNKNYNFVYCHQEKHFCYDGIINNIFGLDFVEEISFDNDAKDDKFSTQLRKEAILGLLAPIFQHLPADFFLNQQDIQKFKIISKNHIYTKWFCLVALDKIVNGEIPNLRKSILDKRQQLYKNRKPIAVQVSQDMKNFYYLLGVDLYNQDKIQETSESIVIEEQKLKQQQKNQVELSEKVQTNSSLFKYFQSQSSGNQSPQKQKNEQIVTQSPTKSQNDSQTLKMSKKLKLIQKLLAKGSKVLTKHNLHQQQIQLNRQNCLICKQHGNPQNSLFYLGNLMKIDPRNIFFQPGMNSSYTINLCLHVICEKCFQNTMKSNTTLCPLCKKVSNIIFPFLGNDLTEQSRRFVENRMNFSLIQTFNQYHADECFILILKSFISQKISGIFLKIMLNQQKQRQTRKLQYYEQFLTNYWNSFEQYEKQYYLVKIQRKIIGKQQNLINQNKIQPKKLIDRILSQIFIGRLIKRYNQDIWKLLDQLQQQVNEQQYEMFISQIQKVMQKVIKRKQKNIVNLPTRKKLVQHYFKTPKTVAEVDHQYQTCSKCKTVSNQNLHCIICNTTYCKMCKHAQVHGNLTLTLNCATKMLEYNTKNGMVSKNVFVNTYKDPWTVEHYSHDDYFAYEIDQYMFNLSIYQWLENVK